MDPLSQTLREEMSRVPNVWRCLIHGIDASVRLSDDGECFLVSPGIEGYEHLHATPHDLPWSTHASSYQLAFRMARKQLELPLGDAPATLVAYVHLSRGSGPPLVKNGIIVDWLDSRAEACYDTHTKAWSVTCCQKKDKRLAIAFRKVMRGLHHVPNPAEELSLE